MASYYFSFAEGQHALSRPEIEQLAVKFGSQKVAYKSDSQAGSPLVMTGRGMVSVWDACPACDVAIFFAANGAANQFETALRSFKR